jgi:hypothetical protein
MWEFLEKKLAFTSPPPSKRVTTIKHVNLWVYKFPLFLYEGVVLLRLFIAEP